MLTKDLKTVIDLMEIAGKNFPHVKIDKYKAFATNGIAIVERDIEFKGEGFILKSELPILKAIHSKNKSSEFIDTSISDMIIDDCDFPPTDMVQKAFDQKFQFEIHLDADVLLKAFKSLKGKDNKIIIQINENNKPVLIKHDNGNALIQPIIS